jgi:hypothetical protein
MCDWCGTPMTRKRLQLLDPPGTIWIIPSCSSVIAGKFELVQKSPGLPSGTYPWIVLRLLPTAPLKCISNGNKRSSSRGATWQRQLRSYPVCCPGLLADLDRNAISGCWDTPGWSKTAAAFDHMELGDLCEWSCLHLINSERVASVKKR